ncbi:AP2/ERF domain-containing protein [Psidium guajava]|nr:AP2/ERF domain-containing protein [Psidium guajava]
MSSRKRKNLEVALKITENELLLCMAKRDEFCASARREFNRYKELEKEYDSGKCKNQVAEQRKKDMVEQNYNLKFQL